MKSLWLDNTEIRLFDDGTVDEIVITDSNGMLLMHMELMCDQLFWFALYPLSEEKDRVDGNIYSKNMKSFIECSLSDQGSAKEKQESPCKT